MSVIIYQDHIEILEEENEQLLQEVMMLRRKLKYYQTIVEGGRMMSGDCTKQPVIFYSEEMTDTKLSLLELHGIQLRIRKNKYYSNSTVDNEEFQGIS